MTGLLSVLLGSPTRSFVREVREALPERDIAHRLQLVSAWAPDRHVGTSNQLHTVKELQSSDRRALCATRFIVQVLGMGHPMRAGASFPWR